MQSLVVGATQFGDKLNADYSTGGLILQFVYPAGGHFPAVPLNLGWTEWDRFVAWVELQRKEEALEKVRQLKE